MSTVVAVDRMAGRGDSLTVLWGLTWAGAAARGGVLFLLGYILPRMIAGHSVTVLQWPVALACYFFAALAVFRFLQARGRRERDRPAVFESVPFQANEGDVHTVFDDSFFPPPQKKAARPGQWTAELLHSLEWRRMTDVVLAFYRFKGLYGKFETAETDGSVFIALHKASDQAGAQPQALLHCVRNPDVVGEAAVYALHARMIVSGIPKAFFTGAATFDAAARAAAASLQITLIDERLLLSMLTRLPAQESMRLLEMSVEGDYKTPTCPACLLKMISRQGEQGRYWGCRAFPRCKQTLPAS